MTHLKQFAARLISVPAILALVLMAPAAMLAQTAPAPAPSGEPFTITGNYAASTSNTVKNGVQSTFEYSLSPSQRWQLRVDEITDLNGNLINLGEGQFKIPINRIAKTAPASFANILLGIHAGLGAVKAASGGVSFGVGAGFSVDYKVSSLFFVRVVELTDVYSRATSNELFGNYNNVNVGAGIGFTF